MSRYRVLAALAVLGGFMLTGIGTAQADNISGSEGFANSSIVSSVGSGNHVGRVHGNANTSQQTATGSRASNQNNTSGVAGNSGYVGTLQGNADASKFVHHRFRHHRAGR